MAHLTYAIPVKRINAESDLGKFRNSLAYQRLHHVIDLVVEKVHNCEVPAGFLNPHIVTRGTPETPKSVPDNKEFSKESAALIKVFDQLEEIIDDTPPLEGPRRFGNMACRDWHKKVAARSSEMLSSLISDEGARIELNFYLVNSFGSEVRLDYGSGHELSFLAFIGGLFQAGILAADVSGRELLALFSRYYDLARRLILVYSLEPAGSHGVWGLDDHFHFIYILGAAEYNVQNDNPVSIVPSVRRTLSPDTISAHKLSNMYVNAISFIFKLKSGPFNEHSPILFDVTRSVSLWAKVQSGLLKMYEVEVLGKFPVVQHFWFGGKFFPWADARTSKQFPTTPVEASVANPKDREVPGLINNFEGTNTTKSNISITKAPWANTKNPRAPISGASSQRGPQFQLNDPRKST